MTTKSIGIDVVANCDDGLTAAIRPPEDGAARRPLPHALWRSRRG
jgi:hypothetical protein